MQAAQQSQAAVQASPKQLATRKQERWKDAPESGEKYGTDKMHKQTK